MKKSILAALAIAMIAFCTTSINAQTYKTDWATQIVLAGSGGTDLAHTMSLKTSGTALGSNVTYTFPTPTAGLFHSNGSGTLTLSLVDLANDVLASSILSPANGGTGVNNGSNTITLGGNFSTGGTLTFSGAFATTITVTGPTSVTLPTSGTLLASGSTAGGDLTGTYPNPTIKTNQASTGNNIVTAIGQGTGVVGIVNGGTNSGTALTASAIAVSNGTALVQGPLGTTTTVLHGNGAGLPTYGQIVNADITNGTIDLTSKVTGILPPANGGTGIANTNTITLGGNIVTAGSFTTVGANALTLTTTGPTNVTLPTSGTLLSSGAGLTTNGVVYATSTSAIGSTGAAASAGMVLTSTGGAPVWATAGGTITLSPSTTNTLVAGNNNNYAINATNSVYYLQNNTGSSVNLTGLNGGTADRVIVLVNNSTGGGASSIQLTSEDVSSSTPVTAQFHLAGNASIQMNIDGTVTLIYDSAAANSGGSTGAWRVISAN